MARTIVYSRARRQAAPGEGPETGRMQTTQPAKPSPDGYPEKLTKYVPAEVLGFFAPWAANIDPAKHPNLLFGAAIIGLICTPIYLWLSARNLGPEQKPRPHFYALAAVSFLAWAITTSRLGETLGLEPEVASLILAAAVFLLPLADAVLEEVLP